MRPSRCRGLSTRFRPRARCSWSSTPTGSPRRVSAGMRIALARESRTRGRTDAHRAGRVRHGSRISRRSRAAGLTAGGVRARHSRPDYRVAFLGFAPGFAYLPGFRGARRLATPGPRTRVPAGSVAIGGRYTGIYPDASPGGWRLIGQAAIRLLDPEADSPRCFAPATAFASSRSPRGSAAARGPRAGRRARPASFGSSRPASPRRCREPVRGRGSSGVPRAARWMRWPSRARTLGSVMRWMRARPRDRARRSGPSSRRLRNARSASRRYRRRSATGDPLRRTSRSRWRRATSSAWAECGADSGVTSPSGAASLRARAAPRAPSGRGDGHAGRWMTGARESRAAPPPSPGPAGEISLRVLPGPEADHFAPAELDRFCESAWRVSGQSEPARPAAGGTRSAGAPSGRRDPAVAHGSRLDPGSGRRPSHRVGAGWAGHRGYPRIATVIGADLPLLGRAAPGACCALRASASNRLWRRAGPLGSTMSLP